MASTDQSILSLSASQLSVTIFSTGAPNGIVLEQVVHQSINGDPDQKDHWLRFVEEGLVLLAHKVSLKSITSVVLPGWSVLSKLLKVARIDGEGQGDVIRFEAENTLPSGLNGFDWTYRILRDDGFERDVLVQAVASTFLEELLALLKRRGINPRVVDALISTELSALGAQYGSETGASVLLDVGARSVSLTVLAAGELPFIRSFNFGGSLVTQSIARELKQSFTEAELLKLESVRSLTESRNLEILNQASEGFVTRLVNEVQRSLALYRRQGQSSNPERILLTGGASQLPGLADYLERKTRISTSFYDPFRGITSGRNLSTTQTSRLNYALPAHIGLVYAQLDPMSIQGNLLPSAMSHQLEFSDKKPWWIAAAVFVLLAGMVVGLKFHISAWDLQSRITALEAELVPLESLVEKVNEAHESYTQLLVLASAKSEIVQQRNAWVRFLSDLQDRLNKVEDVWLESVQVEASESPGAAERLRVTGRLLDRANPLSQVSNNSRGRVETLLGSFENSPFIQSVEDRRFDTSRPGILSFDFSLVINPETSL
jgi:type IV pilus assembly protein PilM